MKHLSNDRLTLVANRARAIGDPTRVRILSILEGGKQPVGQIAAAADTRQSTASKHLQVLYHAGLVQRRRDASVVYYWLTSSEVLRCCRALASRRLDARKAR
jgi:DNA-binding transcriptional ArsR family regulator